MKTDNPRAKEVFGTGIHFRPFQRDYDRLEKLSLELGENKSIILRAFLREGLDRVDARTAEK